MSVMRNRLLPALPALLVVLTARPVAAQTSLELRWELVGDSIAAFTLTNRGPKALPPSGWAIYYNALHGARPGSVGAGGRVHHRRLAGRPAPPGAGSRVRWIGARRQRADPVRHGRVAQSEFRAAGALRRFRRREGRGSPLERLRGRPVRASQRRGPREAIRARLRDSQSPRERFATGLPDAGAADERSGSAALHGDAAGRGSRVAEERSGVRGGIPAPLFQRYREGSRPACPTRGWLGRRSDLTRGVLARGGFPPRRSYRGHVARRRLLWSPVAAQSAASADSARGSHADGDPGGGRSALRLPRVHARRLPQLPPEAARAAHARSPRPLQAQCLSHSPHGR